MVIPDMSPSTLKAVRALHELIDDLALYEPASLPALRVHVERLRDAAWARAETLDGGRSVTGRLRASSRVPRGSRSARR